MTSRWVLAAGAIAVGGVIVFLPYLPRGTDLYVHVLWPWQVMRCLASWSLPVWLPDLNAGFGSPGLGLYSPLAPMVSGLLGLLLDGGGRGVRAALLMTAALVVLVAPGDSRRARLATAASVLLAPAVWIELFGRFPVAELMSLPLAWVLLESAAGRGWRWSRDGVLLALLWLVHAPTTVMVIVIAGVAALGVSAREPPPDSVPGSAGRERIRNLIELAQTGATAAVLTMWHWWPLLESSSDFPMGDALTAGQHHPLRNLIGVASPHLPDLNIAMGWAAIGLLLGLLVSGGWRSARGRLAIVAVFMASLPSLPVWRLVEPLAWLQFPWRFLVPACLLAAPAIAACLGRCTKPRRAVVLFVWLFPLLGLPTTRLVDDPGLKATMSPGEAGAKIYASFSGNPLLIDVREHRPLWWNGLAPAIELLEGQRGVALTERAEVGVTEWRPLRRRLVVESPRPTVVVVRLLADRHWLAEVDGRAVDSDRWGAAVALHVPAGRHVVGIRWQSDWRAWVGAGCLLLALAGIVLARRRRLPVSADAVGR